MSTMDIYKVIEENGGVKGMLEELLNYCILHQDMEYFDALTDLLNTKKFSYKKNEYEKINIYND